MQSKFQIQLVMFDMAGTTINDVVDGAPLVVTCLKRASKAHGMELSSEQITEHRGKQKQEMVRALVRLCGKHGGKAHHRISSEIYRDFLSELNQNIDKIDEIEGTAETFRTLKRAGILIAVGSGFPFEVVEQIVHRLGWTQNGLIDYYSSADKVGQGRPSPKMIQDAMQTLKVNNPRTVMKVGDTTVDIEEGKNAGVWTVAVLTGAHSQEKLTAAEPDDILPSIRELPHLLRMKYATPR